MAVLFNIPHSHTIWRRGGKMVVMASMLVEIVNKHHADGSVVPPVLYILLSCF
jgi:hypothetical protein